MSICIMLYSIELFPPVNYDFGPLEACFSVAPAFVDAMLPAPFLHEFQRNCPFFMNSKEIVLSFLVFIQTLL